MSCNIIHSERLDKRRIWCNAHKRQESWQILRTLQCTQRAHWFATRRPVISGCGSYTYNMSKFVDHHAKSTRAGNWLIDSGHTWFIEGIGKTEDNTVPKEYISSWCNFSTVIGLIFGHIFIPLFFYNYIFQTPCFITGSYAALETDLKPVLFQVRKEQIKLA